MFQRLFSSTDGYALTELAIALIVIGIIGGMGLSGVTHYLDFNRRTITIKNHEIILRALGSYINRMDALPGAADPSQTGSKFGKADSSRTVGIVPFKTLGLEESDTMDGYKNYITYVANKTLIGLKDSNNKGFDTSSKSRAPSLNKRPSENIGKSNFCSDFTVNKLDKSITIQDLDLDDNQFIAVALVSHGPGGHGAFTRNGKQKETSTPGTYEDKNAIAIKTSTGGKITLHKRPYSTSGDDLFRHHVTFVTRDNLRAIYGLNPCQK